MQFTDFYSKLNNCFIFRKYDTNIHLKVENYLYYIVSNSFNKKYYKEYDWLPTYFKLKEELLEVKNSVVQIVVHLKVLT